jgi:hypothetical protein
MEMNMMVNGKMTKGMAKGLSTIPMEVIMMANLKMINLMAKVFSLGLMAANKKECIRMGS